jgi:lipopolysaccharide assembly protein A
MHILRWVVGTLLFLALLFVSLQNSELVTLKFYGWWSWQAPLIFIVLIAFATGVAAGLIAGAVRSSRLKRQLNRLRRERSAGEPAPAPHGAVPARRSDGAT